MILGRRFTFAAAHRLPHVREGHPCGRMHGHNYRLDVEAYGPVSEPEGWILDLDVLDALVRKHVISGLDHRCLNEIKGLENPTVENLCLFVWSSLAKPIRLSGAVISRVEIAEDDASWCIYRGPGREPAC